MNRTKHKNPRLSSVIVASHYFEADSLFSRIFYALFQKCVLGNRQPSYYYSSEPQNVAQHGRIKTPETERLPFPFQFDPFILRGIMKSETKRLQGEINEGTE